MTLEDVARLAKVPKRRLIDAVLGAIEGHLPRAEPTAEVKLGPRVGTRVSRTGRRVSVLNLLTVLARAESGATPQELARALNGTTRELRGPLAKLVLSGRVTVIPAAGGRRYVVAAGSAADVARALPAPAKAAAGKRGRR